jgi:hypothetical protein
VGFDEAHNSAVLQGGEIVSLSKGLAGLALGLASKLAFRIEGELVSRGLFGGSYEVGKAGGAVWSGGAAWGSPLKPPPFEQVIKGRPLPPLFKEIAPKGVDSVRVLERAIEEPGPYHNFPKLVDESIFEGERFEHPGNYIEYRQRGIVEGTSPQKSGPSWRPGSKGISGIYEIGVNPLPSGEEMIVHRFFRKD